MAFSAVCLRQQLCGVPGLKKLAMTTHRAAVTLPVTSPSYRSDSKLDLGQHCRIQDRLHRVRGTNQSAQSKIPTIFRVSPERRPLGFEQKQLLKSLRQCTNGLDWEGAMIAFDSIPPGADEDWMPVYNVILRICCKAFRYQEAKRVWERLPCRDASGYSMLIALCGKLKYMDEVDSLLEEMETNCIEKLAPTYMGVLAACAEAHSWTRAISILDEMKQKNSDSDCFHWEYIYSAVMTSCARANEKMATATLLDEFRQRGTATESHYNSMLVACSKDGEAARKVFADMKVAGLTPRMQDWRVLISCQSNSFEDTRRLYLEFKADMPEAPFEEVWAAMLNIAYDLQNESAMLWIMEEMRSCGVDPNLWQYITTPSLRRKLKMVWKTLEQRNMQAYDKSISTDPLPKGWSSTIDPSTNREYYWRDDDPVRTTTWARPVVAQAMVTASKDQTLSVPTNGEKPFT